MKDRRPTLIIPRDAESVRKEADERWHGDAEKVSTTIYQPGEVHGVAISSRYDKSDEYVVMAALINWLPPELRDRMMSIYCDSKAVCTWSIVLKKCDEITFDEIKTLINSGLIRLDGGHNGVYFTFETASGAPPGDDYLDPIWYEGAEDDDYFASVKASADEIMDRRYNGNAPVIQRPGKAPEEKGRGTAN